LQWFSRQNWNKPVIKTKSGRSGGGGGGGSNDKSSSNNRGNDNIICIGCPGNDFIVNFQQILRQQQVINNPAPPPEDKRICIQDMSAAGIACREGEISRASM